jgi:hypothetical protein
MSHPMEQFILECVCVEFEHQPKLGEDEHIAQTASGEVEILILSLDSAPLYAHSDFFRARAQLEPPPLHSSSLIMTDTNSPLHHAVPHTRPALNCTWSSRPQTQQPLHLHCITALNPK